MLIATAALLVPQAASRPRLLGPALPAAGGARAGAVFDCASRRKSGCSFASRRTGTNGCSWTPAARTYFTVGRRARGLAALAPSPSGTSATGGSSTSSPLRTLAAHLRPRPPPRLPCMGLGRTFAMASIRISIPSWAAGPGSTSRSLLACTGAPLSSTRTLRAGSRSPPTRSSTQSLRGLLWGGVGCAARPKNALLGSSGECAEPGRG